MCEEWLGSFELFYAHVGARPPGMSLDRVNNDEGYRPGNVRWATASEQSRNQRKSIYLDVSEVRMHLIDAATQCGIKPRVLYDRLRLGWSVERAMSEPVRALANAAPGKEK